MVIVFPLCIELASFFKLFVQRAQKSKTAAYHTILGSNRVASKPFMSIHLPSLLHCHSTAQPSTEHAVVKQVIDER